VENLRGELFQKFTLALVIKNCESFDDRAQKPTVGKTTDQRLREEQKKFRALLMFGPENSEPQN
jgi:hypothetical protein